MRYTKILTPDSSKPKTLYLTTMGIAIYSPSTDREVESKWQFSVATPNFFTAAKLISRMYSKEIHIFFYLQKELHDSDLPPTVVRRVSAAR